MGSEGAELPPSDSRQRMPRVCGFRTRGKASPLALRQRGGRAAATASRNPPRTHLFSDRRPGCPLAQPRQLPITMRNQLGHSVGHFPTQRVPWVQCLLMSGGLAVQAVSSYPVSPNFPENKEIYREYALFRRDLVSKVSKWIIRSVPCG